MGIGTVATFSFSTFFKFYLPMSFSCKRRKVGMLLFEPAPAPVPPVLISRQDSQQPAPPGGLTFQPLPNSRLPSTSYPWAHMDLSSPPSKAGTPKAQAHIHTSPRLPAWMAQRCSGGKLPESKADQLGWNPIDWLRSVRSPNISEPQLPCV